MKSAKYRTAFMFMAITTIGLSNNVSVAEYKEFISKSEGNKNIPYKCSAGHLTVGIGHKLLPSDKIKNKYTEVEIDNFFISDLKSALTIARNKFPSFDTQPKEVKLVLVSLCFNLGDVGVSKFTKFRQAINKSNYYMAANELKDSLWYKQVGLRGKKYVMILNKLVG